MNNTLIIKVITITIISLSFMNAHGQNLEKHQWNNRVLVVKTLDPKSTKYEEQLTEFNNSNEGFIDRKLVLYKIDKDEFTFINYDNRKLNYSGKLTNKLAKSILNEKEVFEVMLIGLDGRIKLQQTEILTKEELFSTIDSMPMRKNEMKNQ